MSKQVTSRVTCDAVHSVPCELRCHADTIVVGSCVQRTDAIRLLRLSSVGAPSDPLAAHASKLACGTIKLFEFTNSKLRFTLYEIYYYIQIASPFDVVYLIIYLVIVDGWMRLVVDVQDDMHFGRFVGSH
jgi:hypothetical protein